MAKEKASSRNVKFDGARRIQVCRSDSKFTVTKKMKDFYDAIKN